MRKVLPRLPRRQINRLKETGSTGPAWSPSSMAGGWRAGSRLICSDRFAGPAQELDENLTFRLINKIGHKARLFKSTAEAKERVQEDVSLLIVGFERVLRDPTHDKQLLEKIILNLRDGGRGSDRGSLSENLLGPVHETLASLSDTLTAGLEGRDLLVHQLGRLVGGGTDLGRTVQRPLELDHPQNGTDENILHGQNSVFDSLLVTEWIADINVRLKELGIFDSIPPEVLRRPIPGIVGDQIAAEASFSEFVDRLAASIRTALADRCTDSEARTDAGQVAQDANSSAKGGGITINSRGRMMGTN